MSICTCCSQLQRQVLIQREVSWEEGHGASHGPGLPGAKWPSVAVRPMNWSQQYLCYLPAGWDALAGWCLTLEWQQSIVLSTSLQYQAHLFVFLGGFEDEGVGVHPAGRMPFGPISAGD